MIEVLHSQEPKSLVEAQGDDRWMEAMQSEYGSIMKNNTWDLLDRPPKCKVIGTKWVYKTKYNSHDTLDKYKARLMAKGYAQVQGFDYQDTFAPTARLTTICSVLALVALEGWLVYQMDVKSTFLNIDLKEEVYAEQPPGFVLPSSERKVCQLKKVLYELKPPPKAWYQRIDAYLFEGVEQKPI